jgi:membrane-bound lytic murein transglycosylase MltF
MFFGSFALARPTEKSAEPSANKPYAFDDLTRQKFTGDLDGMIERRLIRVLVTYSKTHYFVDKGTQRGLTYDFGRLFEDDLNKRPKKKHVRVHVVFIPMARDELIPALVEGRGDIAAANLTITAERLKLVDFTNPTTRNVSEIVLTGPGAEPIFTLQTCWEGRSISVNRQATTRAFKKSMPT